MNQLIRRLNGPEGAPPRQDVGFADPMDFLTAELEKCGKMRPVKAAPTSAALITLPFLCSDNGQPFFVTLAQDRTNEPYHIKSLERTYTKLLNTSGYALSNAEKQTVGYHNCDWTGFQCFHCGAGRCAGNYINFAVCSVHGAFCGNRVEAIHGGGTKLRCPGCAVWCMAEVSQAPVNLSGVGYVATKSADGGRTAARSAVTVWR